MTKQNYPENKNNIFSDSFKKAGRNLIKNTLLIYYWFSFTCLISLLVFLCSSSTVAQTNQSTSNSDWIGSYYFSETAPKTKRRNPSDVVPSASYEITIEERDDKLIASFSANGVQLFEAYECLVVVKKNTLEFYFQNLSSADIQNFRKFKKGDLLFSLTKTGNGKTVKYLFQPAAYTIVRVNQGKQKTPVYFEKPQV